MTMVTAAFLVIMLAATALCLVAPLMVVAVALVVDRPVKDARR